MPITISSNISALRAQRDLAKSSKALYSVFDRLSSGQRINRASDDAAGLSIAESLRSDVRILNQGLRNANDGLSAIRIADGALAELTLIVTRITELAEQSANGVNSTAQRAALDQEAQKLADEFARIADTTSFNNIRLLDGSVAEIQVQVGTSSVVHSRLQVALVSGATQVAGDGTFKASTSFALTQNAFDVIEGDFDGDGDLDLISEQRLLTNDGTGSFTVSNNTVPGVYLKTADLDGDGNLDIIGTSELDDTIRISLGVGDGTFKANTSFATNDRPYNFDVKDLNGDGKLDLVIAAEGTQQVFSVLMGNGDGSFAVNVSYNVGAITADVALADINGDGKLDAVTAGTHLKLSLGTGSGTFQAATTLQTSGGADYVQVAVGDVNNDGFVDVVAAARNTDTIDLLLGYGDGTFKARITHSIAAFATDRGELQLSDLNADGFLDVVTALHSTTSAQVLLAQNNGSSFAAATNLVAGGAPRGVVIADFNGDDALDIVTGNGIAGTSVSIFLANTQIVSGMPDFELLTQDGARATLESMRELLAELSSGRASLGAAEARLTTAIANNQVTGENAESARSSIVDADIAMEAASLVRVSILQEAGAAVLAQANQQTALALALLRFEQ
ncbi:MAG: VCBS repeat-containing protein [Bdellovibrionales bacterium]|nr:VCBS repeat-containing protein [Bdellovibrionales bacterium]